MPDKKQETMNLYEKIQEMKLQLLNMNLKKSWENSYAKFKYYELWDFLPQIIQLCKEYKVFSRILFNNENAVLELVNIENPTETATYTSPMRELELKWCNQIQALGWTETYQRRYLYMNAFDIVESDMFDAVAWDEKKAEVKKEVKRFNKEQFEKMKQNTEYLKKFKTSDELLKDIKKLWYSISDEMKLKVADARAEVPEDK